MASNTSRNTNQQDPTPETHPAQQSDLAQIIASTDDSTREPILLPKQAPQTQVLKRKEGSDDRYSNPAATTALFISDLPDDDVRGTYKIPASSPGELILELRAIFGKYIVRTEEGVDEILREFDEKTQGEDPQDVGIKEVLVDMISRKIKAAVATHVPDPTLPVAPLLPTRLRLPSTPSMTFPPTPPFDPVGSAVKASSSGASYDHISCDEFVEGLKYTHDMLGLDLNDPSMHKIWLELDSRKDLISARSLWMIHCARRRIAGQNDGGVTMF